MALFVPNQCKGIGGLCCAWVGWEFWVLFEFFCCATVQVK